MARSQTASSTKEQNEESTKDVATVRALDSIVPEVMGGASSFDEDALRSLTSFDDAVRLAAQEHGEIDLADETLGDGFMLLDKKQKDRLIGVPCLFMEWAFRDGDFGSAYVSVRIAARNPDGGVSKYIVNDGSTGIAEQLAKYTQKTGKTGGLMVKKGLRASTYDTDADGKPLAKDADPSLKKGTATTYYIDTAA